MVEVNLVWSDTKTSANRRHSMTGLLGVQAVKLRLVVQRDEIRIAASPGGILEARLPGLMQGIHGIRLSVQFAVETSRIVKNGGFIGAQGNREVQFAQGVVRPSQISVVGAQQDARPRVFWYLF